jgi:hypothetical protein
MPKRLSGVGAEATGKRRRLGATECMAQEELDERMREIRGMRAFLPGCLRVGLALRKKRAICWTLA